MSDELPTLEAFKKRQLALRPEDGVWTIPALVEGRLSNVHYVPGVGVGDERAEANDTFWSAEIQRTTCTVPFSGWTRRSL